MPKSSSIVLNLGNGLSMMLGLPTILSWNTNDRPKNAKKGTLGFNIKTNSIEYWDGNNWFTASLESDSA